MNDALFGAIVGGLAALGGNWLAARYSLKEKKEELGAEAERQRQEALNRWRETKVDRYAPFLAAYYAEEARIVEILENLEHQRQGWEKRVIETVESPERTEDLATLNKSLGWIALLSSEDADPLDLARDASTTFDSLVSQLTESAEAAKQGKPVRMAPLKESLEDLRSVISRLTKNLRREVQPRKSSG